MTASILRVLIICSHLIDRLLILENFEDAILNISSRSPYSPYLACVRNMTDNLAKGSPGDALTQLMFCSNRFRHQLIKGDFFKKYILFHSYTSILAKWFNIKVELLMSLCWPLAATCIARSPEQILGGWFPTRSRDTGYLDKLPKNPESPGAHAVLHDILRVLSVLRLLKN